MNYTFITSLENLYKAKLTLKFKDKIRITRTIGVIGRIEGDKYRFL